MRLAALGTLAALAVGCGGSSPHALISVGADATLEQYDLYVRDEMTRTIFESGWSPVASGGKPIDTAKAPFKIGLSFSHPGDYTVLVTGAIGPIDASNGKVPDLARGGRQFFWIQSMHADGDAEVSAHLVEVGADDADRDVFPDKMKWPQDQPAAAAFDPHLLDCDDGKDTVNPFASEKCGNKIDENCDGMDDACVDSDGDGDPDDTDCKPHDPSIHNPTTADPFPESANCCGYSLGKTGADANKSFNGDPTCHPSTCDDGIDQDCSAKGDPSGDVKCIVDEDCDGFRSRAQQNDGCASPPDKNQMGMLDCDDCDAAIHPGAIDVCGNGKDDNCDGNIDETCVGCDLDGDGFQRDDQANACPDKNYPANKPRDCDDEDAGVFPGSTDAMHPLSGKLQYIAGPLATCKDAEGGTVCGALRGLCKNVRVDLSTPQDADCDMTPWKSCPPANCDADRDGFIDAAKAGQCDPNGALQPYDCDDADPETFPNAPPRCGETKAHNCAAVVPCGVDADGDGFDSMHDCDDGDKDVHPFAVEKCNGKDDDCDGLLDELNPDATGARMAQNGQVLHCNDSGTGLCAPETGHCVCSQSSVAKLFFDGKRVACPGETPAVDADTSSSAPRCYGAPQPKPQSCNPQAPQDDDCDGRVDAPDGKNFPLVGMDCWPGALGECKSALGGKIVGCDMSQTNCFASKGVNPWFVCDQTKVCPVAEKCNGFDDDCNGGVPANETDSDGDGYMQCGSSFSGQGLGGVSYDNAQPCEMVRAPGLGCGDCAEGFGKTGGVDNASIHPGQQLDVCDGVDTDCDPSTADGTADPACANGLTCCGATRCHNLTNETNNCSACGDVCSGANASTSTCMSSTCGYSCNAGWADCQMTAPNLNGCETHIAVDTANCGACGRGCSNSNVSVLACANGACTSSCQAGWGNCGQPAGNLPDDGCETHTAVDVANCGGCSRACSGTQVAGKNCANGVCNSTCNAGYSNCTTPSAPGPDDGCETHSDVDGNNCGGCGRACSGTQVAAKACAGGLCTSTCNAGYANCTQPGFPTPDDGCETHVAVDVNNCGACSRACSGTQVAAKACVAGLCTSTCNAGFGNCSQPPGNLPDDGCETDITQPANCGGCGRACSGTQVASLACAGGVCTSTCNAGYSNCSKPTAPTPDDGCETHSDADTNNCGGCGRVCSGTQVAAKACAGGLCTSTCNVGYANCTQPGFPTPDDGCETHIAIDPANCGGCGNNCSANGWSNVATYACNGTCQIGTCAAGFGDCDGQKLNGCEANLASNTTCGGSCTDCTAQLNNQVCIGATKCGCTNANTDCDVMAAVPLTSACTGSQCVCGNTGGACAAGQECCNPGTGFVCRKPPGAPCGLNTECCSGNCKNNNTCQ